MIGFTRRIVMTALIAACTDSLPSPLPPPPPGIQPPPPPALTSLTLTLRGPASDDGALLLELKGPRFGTVSPADSTSAFSSEMISDSVLRVAIIGNVSNAALIRVALTNPGNATAYQATVLEVTDRAGQLRGSLTAYSIQITGQ